MLDRTLIALLIACAGISLGADGPPSPTRTPRVRTVDLDVGESVEVELCDGSKAPVKLLAVEESRDPIRSAVRKRYRQGRGQRTGDRVDVGDLSFADAGRRSPDRLPDHAGLHDEHRPGPLGTDQGGLACGSGRPAHPGSSRGRSSIRPASAGSPARPRWPTSRRSSTASNSRLERKIYYHSGLDIGGAEGLVDVLAATAGLVVSVGNATLPGYDGTPVAPRYDVAYLLDDRGWYYRYSHLQSFDAAIKPGTR